MPSLYFTLPSYLLLLKQLTYSLWFTSGNLDDKFMLCIYHINKYEIIIRAISPDLMCFICLLYFTLPWMSDTSLLTSSPPEYIIHKKYKPAGNAAAFT